MPERTELFNVLMSPDERAMLARLAEDEGVSAGSMVRTLVRREYAARYGKDRPVRASKRKK